MTHQVFFIVAFLCLTPLAGAAERLRITEFDGASNLGSSQQPPPRVLINLTGRTQAERDLIANLWTQYASAFPSEHQRVVQPDFPIIRIELEHAGQSLLLSACHPIWERDPHLIKTTHGVVTLSGRTREEVLREEPQWYQQFHVAFDAILAAAQTFKQPSK